MTSLRPDGLPHPYTAEQEFLAAILDEVRGIRLDRMPPAPEESVSDDEVITKEQASEAGRTLSLSDEVASEAGHVLASYDPDKAEEKSPAAKKPAVKKPAVKRTSASRKAK
jgi:hypothetical protein